MTSGPSESEKKKINKKSELKIETLVVTDEVFMRRFLSFPAL